jgi:hypothetical protein
MRESKGTPAEARQGVMLEVAAYKFAILDEFWLNIYVALLPLVVYQ